MKEEGGESMARGASGDVIRQVGRLFGEGTLTGLTDSQLLDRFRSRRDEAAFEAIVARHGPMVLGVCRGVLRHAHDVDDAFQAAFLVLVKKSGTIHGREGVGGWLYRVSYRIALRAKTRTARSERHEPSDGISHLDPERDALRAELHAIVHAELDRLPEKYRAPVVLCDLEGLTHDEAAQRLQWPIGTVKGRLSRARDRLRERLKKRGLTEPAGVVTALFAADSARAAVPDTLLRATVSSAVAMVTGTTGAVPASVAVLVSGVLRAMTWTKVGQIGVLTAALGVVSGGFVALHGQGGAGPGTGAGAGAGAVQPITSDFDSLQGTWRLISSESAGRINAPTNSGTNYVFRGNQILSYTTSRDGERSAPYMMARFQTDPTRTPKEMDLSVQESSSGETLLRAIYRLNGDILTLCFSSDKSKKESRPQQFKTQEGDSLTLLVLHRVAPKPDASLPAQDEDMRNQVSRLYPPNDLWAMQGVWQLVESEAEGKVERSNPRLQPASGMVIKGDIRYSGVLVEGEPPTLESPQHFTIDEDQTPHAIDFHNGDPKSHMRTGIYKLDGDTLTLCMNTLLDKPRPTSFDTKPGLPLLKTVWRRVPVQNQGPVVGKLGEDDLNVLQGTWRTISYQLDGETHPVETQDGRGGGFIVEGTSIRLFQSTDSGPQFDPKSQARILLDPERSPRTITFLVEMDGARSVSTQIYRLEGDMLTVCGPRGGAPDQSVPTEFQTRRDDGRVLTVYRKQSTNPQNPPRGGVPRETKPEATPTNTARPPADETPERSSSALAVTRAELDLEEIELAAGRQSIERLLAVRERLLAELDDAAALQTVSSRSDENLKTLKTRIAQLHDLVEQKKEEYLKQRTLFERNKSILQADERKRSESQGPPEPIAVSAEPYRLRPGDLLVVEVLEALPGRPITGERLVRPDGTISLGFYGELAVAGLTRHEIKEKLIEHLRKFLADKVLGLVDTDPATGREIAVKPMDTYRVFVDDSLNFLDRARPIRDSSGAPTSDAARLEAVERKLDEILKRLDRK